MKVQCGQKVIKCENNFFEKKIEKTQGELAVIAKKGPHAPLCVHYIIITRRVEEEAGAACKDRHLIENKQERN